MFVEVETLIFIIIVVGDRRVDSDGVSNVVGGGCSGDEDGFGSSVIVAVVAAVVSSSTV